MPPTFLSACVAPPAPSQQSQVELPFLTPDLAVLVAQHLGHDDLVHLSCTSKYWRAAVSQPVVWRALVTRTYSTLPKAVSAQLGDPTAPWRQYHRQLSLKKPACLALTRQAQQLGIPEGSEFEQALYIDGRREVNFTLSFPRLQPGHYRIMWRMRLQPGYHRGYINFKPLFSRSRPEDPQDTAYPQQQLNGPSVSGQSKGVVPRFMWPFRRKQRQAEAADEGKRVVNARRAGAVAPAPGVVAVATAAQTRQLLHSLPATQPEDIKSMNACLSLLYGSYSCSWKLINPEVVGRARWVKVVAGTLTVRWACDVHIRSVMVQVRGQTPHAAVQDDPGCPGMHRGVLIDSVELQPCSNATPLRSLLPGCLGRGMSRQAEGMELVDL